MKPKPNFVLIPDDAPSPAGSAPVRTGGALVRLRSMATTIVTATASPAAALFSVLRHAEPPTETATPVRPRLVVAVDATASLEPAWAAARQLTDALVKALPGQLDVALAVHGDPRVHIFTAFTSNAATLRDRAAGVGVRGRHDPSTAHPLGWPEAKGGAGGYLYRRRSRRAWSKVVGSRTPWASKAPN